MQPRVHPHLALLAVLLLVTTSLAGCVGVDEPVAPAGSTPDPGPAPGLAKLGTVIPLTLQSFDGTELDGTVYLPDRSVQGCSAAEMRGGRVAEACRVPVLLELSPYMGNLDTRNDHDSRRSGEHAPDILYRYFLERGYAIALFNVRGTGDSGGCFELGGVREQRDAHHLVERLANASWSTGNVAMTGVSYPGTTPWTAAVTTPPSLDAIVPVEGISDMYEYMYRDGVAYTHGPLFNTYYTALVDWAFTPGDTGAATQQADRAPGSLCPGVAERLAKGYETWVDGTHDGFWDERDYAARADEVEAATLLVHGFQDWNVDPDAFEHVLRDLDGPKRALLGQWEHNIPWDNSYNEDWDYPAYNATVLAWLDRFLKGEDTGALDAPPVLFQDSSGAWHNASTWPPERSRNATLYPGADGDLARHPSPGTAASTFQSTPGQDPGPDADPRSQVVYTTPRLQEEHLVAGNPRLDLHLEVDRPGGHVVAVLFEVTDDGEWQEVDKAYRSLAHRETRDTREDVPVGQVMEVPLNFYPTATRVEAGHRLALVVAGEDPDRVHADPFQPRVTVHHDAEHPSRLTLPLFPLTEGDPGATTMDAILPTGVRS